MGKYIEPKDSQVQNKIIKKVKGNEGSRPNKKKRKLHSSKGDGPDIKRLKKDSDELSDKLVFQDLNINVKENAKHKNLYVSLIYKDDDLFSEDLLKTRYDQYTKYNFIHIIFDEIALEGLDGITIEALWKRLTVALKNVPSLSNIKNITWKCICINENVKFFELPEPRNDLTIINQYDYMEVRSPDIYKFECAPLKSGVFGSCATLNSRTDISHIVRTMSLNEAFSTYSNKLVIVADQILRTNALYDDLTDINYEIVPLEYCILERIGRSRQLGEITQGPTSIGNSVNMDPKSIHHYRNRLIRQNLVAKQCFAIKTYSEQYKTGRLLQLRRFYIKHKTNFFIMAESIISYIKKCPNVRADYGMLRRSFQHIPKRFFKSSEFLKYFHTKQVIPYRHFYPDATKSEYMIKSLTRERFINVFELKNPYVNITANWTDSLNDESSDDEDEDDNTETGRGRLMNVEFTQELYLFIKSKGAQGCSSHDIFQTFDIDTPTIRNCIRKLQVHDVISTKKLDIGKQRHNQYIAKCFLEDFQPTEILPPVGKQQISTIEKLRQRQKQKVDSLTLDRIYSREQFEAEYNLYEHPSYPPISVNVPSVICDYLISCHSPKTPSYPENITLTQYFHEKILFNLNLSFPEFAEQIKLDNAKHDQIKSLEFPTTIKSDIPPEYIYNKKSKLDNLTKAVQLLILLNNIQLNPAVINFLSNNCDNTPKNLKRKHSEIDLESKDQVTDNSGSNVEVKRKQIPIYMGPEPVIVSKEEREMNICVEVMMSTPPTPCLRADVSKYEVVDLTCSDKVVSRLQILLDEISVNRICEEMRLVRAIDRKEKREGCNTQVDRKSVRRLLQKLVREGYIKIYIITISQQSLKKVETFVCHPEITYEHELIKGKMQQIIWKFFCLNEEDTDTRPNTLTCPFTVIDVQTSISELKCLEARMKAQSQKSSRKIGSAFGYKPKFAKMSILHELLFYLIYELDQDVKPLSETDILHLFRKHRITLTEADLKKMPPIYCKELSWKMFIPPLPVHWNWGNGWALLCDVILRIPISVMTKLHCISYYSSELHDILQHPIKRFYLLKNVSQHLRFLITFKRRYIGSISQSISRLAYCGLVQFGPSKYHEKEQSFIYLNRKASLLDTACSQPGYHKISLMNYKRLDFEFKTLSDVNIFWATMYNICLNTPLSARFAVIGKTITLGSETTKPSLIQVLNTIRTQEEVAQYDNGNVPGDQRGAGGFDSTLWSHNKRNWFGAENKQGFTNDLAYLTFNQINREATDYGQLKIPTVSSKFYIVKAQDIKNLPSPNIKIIKPCKAMPFVKRKVKPRSKNKKIRIRKTVHDDLDRAILKRYNGSLRFKPNWNEEEDKVLIILKIAALFLDPTGLKRTVLGSTIRDILHRVMQSSMNKTTASVYRRWKILNRDLPITTSIDLWVTNLFKLDFIAKRFLPLRRYLQNQVDSLGKTFKLSECEAQNAFVFLCFYIMTHRKEVETTLDGNMTTMDYFNEENIDSTKAHLVSLEELESKYVEPVNKESIIRYVLKGLFHSNIVDRKEIPAWSYQLYKVYQKFNSISLRAAEKEMQEQKMMVCKRHSVRKFQAPYKTHFNYIYAQSTLFSYRTVEESFETYNNIKDSSFEIMVRNSEEKDYEDMIALNEIMTMMGSKISFKFCVPENPFILNPDINDHSDLIQELAKRYQLKLKNERRELEQQLSSQSETEPKNQDLAEDISKDILEPMDTTQLDDDDEPLDLTTTTQTIDSLKNWISDCIDSERVRSPSPELFVLDKGKLIIKEEESHVLDDVKDEGVQILTLEDIKTGMLKVTGSSEKRDVPYITDLTKLLTENFDELETDEKIVALKKHFIEQYPSVESVDIDGFHDYLQDYESTTQTVLNSILKEPHITLSSDLTKPFDDILNKRGCIEDINLANDILTFISEKEYFGATTSELKARFLETPARTLELILTILTENRVLLKTGTLTLRFVHYKYASVWLVESFVMNHENSLLKDTEELDKLQEQLENIIKVTPWIQIKMQPWVRVDGVTNKELVKLWLSNVLSYCNENPEIMLQGLFEKFSFVSPVDIFYLVEILEKLSCLEIRRYRRQVEFDIFEEYGIIEDDKATFLDNFEDMFVRTSNNSFVKLGAFFKSL